MIFSKNAIIFNKTIAKYIKRCYTMSVLLICLVVKHLFERNHYYEQDTAY